MLSEVLLAGGAVFGGVYFLRRLGRWEAAAWAEEQARWAAMKRLRRAYWTAARH